MQDTPPFSEVPLAKLRWRCDPALFPFTTTDDVPPLEGVIGQERAHKALELGMDIARAGYNIYVCGLPGSGRLTAVRQLLAARQTQGPPPPDLCYVYAFKHPERPRLLSVPAGQGKALKKAMEELLTALRQDIPAFYHSPEVQRRITQVQTQAQRREQRLLRQCEQRCGPDFGLLWHEADAMLVPELAPVLDGSLTPLAELERRVEAGQFPADAYRDLCRQHATRSADIQTVFATARRLQQEAVEAVQTLERALVRPLIQQAVAQAMAVFTDPAVRAYIQDVEEALQDDWTRFLAPAVPPAPEAVPGVGTSVVYEDDPFHEYHLNLIVDNSDTPGTPVVFETAPTHKNLFGTIEPTQEYGGLWRSDFLSIRAGAFHRAQGGYLVFDALDALNEPLVWQTLKRTLRYGQVDIQTFEHLSLVPTSTLKPEPMPCNVKVIVLGDAELYEALTHEDEAFKRLFKVKADFDLTIPRHPTTVLQYAGVLSRMCQSEQLRPCDREAVAALVEWGVRLAGRQNKLSARMDAIADVVREADYWASKAGEPLITRAAVERTLQERWERISLLEAKLREMIDEGILLISTDGAVVGQVNGLAVYELEEEYAFGCPIRITAETSMGDAGVVNIEREVELGDATHNKGVLILSGYLRHVYAQDKPLVLSASLCVEQSYDGIAGDSASAAEIYAMLSSLAQLPVAQGIAVTGSVNQKGQVQPISGINEKIEGFFAICRLQGLTGRQGVLLPAPNVEDLMLSEDVMTAVTAGQFHLYPIRTIDEGLPIVFGVPAGQRCAEVWYPAESVNGRVDAQLRRFAESWQATHHTSGYEAEPAVAATAPRYRTR